MQLLARLDIGGVDHGDAAGDLVRGRGMRVAVTITFSGRPGTLACAQGRRTSAASATDEKKMDFNMASPDRVQEPARLHRLTDSRCPATTPTLSPRRFTPLNLRRTPAGNWTTVRGRFPGSRVIAFARLPKHPDDVQWLIGRSLAGYSCGGSRGLQPRSLHLAPGRRFAPGAALRQPPQLLRVCHAEMAAALTRQAAFGLGSAALLPEGYAMPLSINDIAPDFTAASTEGPLHFYDWAGDNWVLFFSHPKDFTPVCTTELGAVAKLKPEFDKRGVKVLGLSVDPVENHAKWSADIAETQGMAPNYPMIGDTDLKVSKLYGMLPADTEGSSEGRTPANNATVRNVFIIGPDKRIKLMLVYPMTTGRNFDEILRVIEFHAAHRQAQGGDAGGLETGRRRHHHRRGQRRGSQDAVPRLQDGQAVSEDDVSTEVVLATSSALGLLRSRSRRRDGVPVPSGGGPYMALLRSILQSGAYSITSTTGSLRPLR